MAVAIITTRGREASLTILTVGYTPAGPTSMILMKDGHNFQQETDTVSDVSGDEIVATNYARQAVTFDPIVEEPDGSVTQQSRMTLFGVVGGGVNDTVGGCYVYENSGNDATSIITACIPFVTPMLTDGTDLRVTPITWVWTRNPF